MTIVSRLKDLCTEKGTTMTAVERELGFGKGLLRTWDSSSPSGEKLKKIALYFNVTTDYLLGVDSNDKLLAKNVLEQKFLKFARIIATMPDDQRILIIKHFEDTINVYTKSSNN
ncbi:MAG: helix-turn-helix domain protein [Eubacterium sp.]|jgi:transcriptional regulator with XRE-family HTH domain|nr:helix-turn-helix domain protein [Eubacterium sp.]